MAAPPTPSATISIDSEAVLAGRNYAGGLCPDGPCSSTFTVLVDGSWEGTSSAGAVARGSVPTTVLSTLASATAATGLLSAPDFTGTCPTAFDGTEVTYTWTSPDGSVHEVSACDRQIPDDDPLVTALDAAEAGWIR